MYCRLLHNDRHLYGDHLKRLNPDDRYMRFSCRVSDAWIDSFVQNINPVNNIIKVIYDSGKVVAAVHIALNNDGNEAEIGISIDSDYRKRGWGHILWDGAVLWCRDHGIKKIETICMSNNRWVINKVRTYNTQMERDGSQTIAHMNVEGKTSYMETFKDYSYEFLGMQRWYQSFIQRCINKFKVV